MWADINLTPRPLRREPATLVISALILAAGTGIAAAMIGLLDSLILKKPDHITEPARLVNVSGARNYIQLVDLAERSRTLWVAGYTDVDLSVGVGPDAALVQVECVTANYFGVLGTEPRTGRFFVEADGQETANRPIVVSHAFWRERFGGQSNALGTSLMLAGREFVVVGVAPSGFRGIEFERVDAWILLTQSPDLCAFTGRNLLMSSAGSWLKTVGRLLGDVDPAQAEAEASTILRSTHAMPDRPGAALQPLQDARTVLVSRSARLARWLVAGALILFAIACLNVAGLAAARSARQRRDIAIRLQLGATRSRILKELLAANAIPPLSALLPAVLIASWTTQFASSFFPAGVVSDAFSRRAAFIMIGLAALATVLSGVGPALYGSRTNPSILSGHQSLVRTTGRVSQQTLIVVQIALSFVLVMGAALFVQSVRTIKNSVGFDFSNTVVVAVDLVRAGYRPLEGNHVIGQLLEQIRTLPGVDSATISSPVLGSGGASIKIILRMPGGPRLGTPLPVFNAVGPGYFATVGTRILRGRAFGPADTQQSEPVAILNEHQATQLSAGDLLGKCIVIGNQACVVVVGISENRRYSALTKTSQEIFVPFDQLTLYTSGDVSSTLIVRTTDTPRTAIRRISSAAMAAFPKLPFVNVLPMEDLVDRQAGSWRAGASLFMLFGFAAALLTIVGLYTLLASINRERLPDIGIRIAVGASRRDIAGLVIRQGALLTSIGAVLGSVLVLAIARRWESLLFDVHPNDVLSFGAAAAAIVIVSAAGCTLPAIQAARLDPLSIIKRD